METKIVYKNILKAAWKGLMSQFWLLAGLLIGFVIIYSLLLIFAVPALLNFAVSAKGEALTVSGIIAIILGVLLLNIFVMGYLKNCFQTLDGEEPQFSAYGQVSRKVFAFIAAYFIYGIIVAIGFTLFIVPGIYIGLRLSFYAAAMVDENTGIIKSFKRSWNITRKQTWRLFVLGIIMTLIHFAGQMACGIGIFISTPFVILMFGYTFRRLTTPTGRENI